MRTVAALVLVTAVFLAGCSGEDEGNASPTAPSSVSTTSTTTAPDVSVIPEVIDENYLNAVVAALDKVDAEATRIIKATNRFPPEAAALLNAIYSDEAFKQQANLWLESFAEDPELKGILPNPGSRKTTILRVIEASPACVWMAVRRDYSQVATDATPGPEEYVALQPLDRSNDPQGHNPTAWMITTDGYRPDETEPSNPCR